MLNSPAFQEIGCSDILGDRCLQPLPSTSGTIRYLYHPCPFPMPDPLPLLILPSPWHPLPTPFNPLPTFWPSCIVPTCSRHTNLQMTAGDWNRPLYQQTGLHPSTMQKHLCDSVRFDPTCKPHWKQWDLLLSKYRLALYIYCRIYRYFPQSYNSCFVMSWPLPEKSFVI